MTPIPLGTHIFLIVVPLAFAIGALVHFSLRRRDER